MVRVIVVALLAATLTVMPSCKKQEKEKAAGKDGGTGAIAVMTATTTATVEAVDPVKRTVTLLGPDGMTKTYTVGRDVVNFDRITVGDKVKATLIDSLAVAVRKGGMSPGAGEGATIALAPRGAKPGAVLVDTMEVSAKVAAVDAGSRTITLENVGGKPKTFKVGPNVNLADLKKSDDVVVRYTQALAILVEKPQDN